MLVQNGMTFTQCTVRSSINKKTNFKMVEAFCNYIHIPLRTPGGNELKLKISVDNVYYWID